MSSSLDGQTITKCFEVVSRCGKEINALFESLDNLFRLELINIKNSLPCVLAERVSLGSDWRLDDSTWVCTDMASSFPLKSKGRKINAEKYLSYQVSLTGDGVLKKGKVFDEPLLHVCLWDHAINFNDPYYVGFPLDKSESPRVIGNRLIDWGNESINSWKDMAWTFSVRLLALNTHDDLKRSVVQPALDLLNRVSPEDALPDGLPGLVFYYSETSLAE